MRDGPPYSGDSEILGYPHSGGQLGAPWALSRPKRSLSHRSPPCIESQELHGRARLLHPRTSSGGILRIQAERGITWTGHSPGNGTGWATTAKPF